MNTSPVIERVERVTAARFDSNADRTVLEAALCDITAVRSWLSAAEGDIVKQLAEQTSFPEAAIAESTRESQAQATKTIERSKTLDAAPDLASKLDAGAITESHVDAVTRAAGGLEGGQRDELIERCDRLSHVAEAASVEQWRHRVRDLVRDIQRDDGIDRLERQRRATSLSTWVDQEGMWNLRGTFDPLTGVAIAARLKGTVESLFAESPPETCPTDPIERNKHLNALALARLITDPPTNGRSGRPEYVVVVDTTGHTGGSTSTTEGPGHWIVTWPIPIEVPNRVLHDILVEHPDDIHPVIVRNGIVLHAPGELNLGRTTRLANRAQRRALRGLYATCAIPGCAVGYDHCKLHHIIWWRHLGRTDLDNLLPVCSKHHRNIHHDSWNITLGPNRELTVNLPDGTTMTTGPPNRRAA